MALGFTAKDWIRVPGLYQANCSFPAESRAMSFVL